jgi:type IV pilus assembly protein PilB
MMNMGVAPFNIASSRDIDHRAAPGAPPVHLQEPMPTYPTRRPAQGRLHRSRPRRQLEAVPPGRLRTACNSGYKGRVGIYQVMPITDEIQRIILTNGNAMQIAEQAKRDGVRDLRQSGLIKVKQGVTTLEEVLGVTNE